MKNLLLWTLLLKNQIELNAHFLTSHDEKSKLAFKYIKIPLTLKIYQIPL